MAWTRLVEILNFVVRCVIALFVILLYFVFTAELNQQHAIKPSKGVVQHEI